ncbi:MAG: LptF/LptG family permease [Pyrinomonadaceae bacterium]|nr:LptF/LptG family permease [Pyrinomonadaceae bacterium]
MRFGWKIAFYITRAVVPYFLFSWLLLSVILFVQQASRFSDIFFTANIPASLVWQLTAALIPNVIAFTCPMAALVGVIIGMTKMQGDSELVAIRAAGVGNIAITAPMAVLGVTLSVFAFLINVYGVPIAASAVRSVAMRAAIVKLESPIEPGVFNTEVAGYTIYVKDGDIDTGRWKNIFIHAEDPKSGLVRLITSSNGRIDSTGEQSELVLENAVSTTFNATDQKERFVSEKIGEFRFAIKTRRGELIEKLGSTDITPEELGLGQLSRYADSKDGRERTEAEILWQRRILLSITPLIFSLLGTGLVLRFNRGGRGFGILMALVSLVGFYLVAFAAEQLARTGRISVIAAGILPIGASIAAIIWFNLVSTSGSVTSIEARAREIFTRFRRGREGKPQRSNLLVDVTTGLRDLDLILNLLRYYALTLLFLAAVFIIFTAFELWRFAGTMDGGLGLLVRYLIYLLPFIYLQLAPSAAMIAVLATYVIKSRQNEIVTWTAAGQSVYRLLFPAFLLMLVIGGVNLALQEYIAPQANLVQDQIRNQLRSRGVARSAGKYWVANDRRIYSFTLSGSASDNEKQLNYGSTIPALSDVTVYEFVDKGERLQTLYRSSSAVWDEKSLRLTGETRRTDFGDGSVSTATVGETVLEESSNPLLEIRKKPSQLSSAETRSQIANLESDIERRSFAVALEKKYSTLLLPFIICLFTAPFALSLSRKGKVITVGYAVGLWLLFMGITALFEQFGLSGSLSPELAVWSPIMLFTLLGIYLLSKVRT